MTASVAALHAAADAAFQRRQYAVAEAYFRQATAKAPRNGALWIGLGLSIAAQGDSPSQLDDADRAFARAQKISPTDAEPTYHAAMLAVQRGDVARADALLQRALAQQPRHSRARFAWAARLQARGAWDAAVREYEAVLEISPRAAEAANNIASIRLSQGQLDSALAALDRALAANPDLAQAWHNKALAHDKRGDLDAAVAAYAALLALMPRHSEARQNYARLLSEIGQSERAMREYEAVLALDPNDAVSRHALAALSGNAPKSAPAEYVRRIFDPMAGNFDQHLVDELGYRVPERVAELLAARPIQPAIHLLDLGCGTGLLARALAAKRLEFRATGVDLSQCMLNRASASGHYAELFESDINTWLASGDQRWTAIALLDVLIYTGDPVPTLTLAVRRLADAGLVAVCVETLAGDETYRLQPTGRYQHSPKAIEALMTSLGLHILTRETLSVRSERGRPTPAVLWVAQK